MYKIKVKYSCILFTIICTKFRNIKSWIRWVNFLIRGKYGLSWGRSETDCQQFLNGLQSEIPEVILSHHPYGGDDEGVEDEYGR